MQKTETEQVIHWDLTTERLRSLLSQAFLYDSDPGLKNVVAEIEPKHVTIRDMSLGAVGVYLIASQRLFKEYNVSEPARVTLSASLYETIRDQFKTEESVSVDISPRLIKVKGKKRSYEEDITVDLKREFPVPIQPLKVTEQETIFVPEGLFERCKFLAKVPVKSFDLPKAGTYGFDVSEGVPRFKLNSSISSEFVGRYEQEPELLEKAKVEDVSALLDGVSFHRLTKNINDSCWFIIDEPVVDGQIIESLVLTRTTPELVSTFILVCNDKE